MQRYDDFLICAFIKIRQNLTISEINAIFAPMNKVSFAKLSPANINSEMHAIDHGSIIYSHTGDVRLRVNFEHWELHAHDVLIFFPGDVVEWEQISPDFTAEVIRYSAEVLRAASLNIEHVVYEQLRADRRCGYRELIDVVVDGMFRIFGFYFTADYYQQTDRMVALLLQAFFLGFYDYLQMHPREDNRDKGTQRQEELFNRFMELLENEFRQGHEVNYYARRMNITAKYLGMIVKQKTGYSPKQIIDEYLILRLKLAMRTTTFSLKQIAHQFCFTDQSALTRYFRSHVGMPPQKYRLLTF